jgi:maltooligosyltrehalose trehalohydrolase
MGQEWGAKTPFLYFTDHKPELGRLVQAGRRREHQRFSGKRSRKRIPDPQEQSTFTRSKLNWEELCETQHQGLLELHKELLRLRKQFRTVHPEIELAGNGALKLRYPELFLVIQLQGAGETIRIPPGELLLSTEDDRFVPDPQPPEIDTQAETLLFRRPGAAIFRKTSSQSR